MPDAFLALHSANGKPLLSREDMEARHELCENMALHAAAFLSERGIDGDTDDALKRCRAGLIGNLALSAEEIEWNVRRIAELKEWPQPELNPPASAR